MPGVATQCDSLGGNAAATTRPAPSRMRTVLALQGRTRPWAVSSALANRASRTVKYWVPWSKLPNSVRRVAMRPPVPRLFSNTETRWPACINVRAQAMPAMPAPTTAMWRCEVAVTSADREEGRDLGGMSFVFCVVR